MFQESFKFDFFSRSSMLLKQESNENIKETKLYTLQKFASEHFRPAEQINRRIVPGTSSTKETVSEKLWSHTSDPRKAPLLMKLLKEGEKFQHAVQIFSNILRYMGDLPSNRQRTSTEYTDHIFGPALRDVMFSFVMTSYLF